MEEDTAGGQLSPTPVFARTASAGFLPTIFGLDISSHTALSIPTEGSRRLLCDALSSGPLGGTGLHGYLRLGDLVTRDRARVLVTVKAQPALSQKHGEVVCVAGIRLDGQRPEWIRLFPVPFRDLEKVVKFKKYQVMEVDVVRHRSDVRPESHIPDMESATLGEVVDTGPGGSWRRRWNILSGLADLHTMCELNRGQRQGRSMPSLAMVRPAQVLDVEVDDTPDFSEAQKAMALMAAEADLFGEAREPLEAPPFTVRYRWRCLDGDCRGNHRQMCVDWEVGGAGRRWLREHDRETVRRMLRDKWLGELCGPRRDTYFFVGNQHLHQQSYLILGVFWPPHDPGRLEPQLSLLD